MSGCVTGASTLSDRARGLALIATCRSTTTAAGDDGITTAATFGREAWFALTLLYLLI
jgi:hypothetical protein